MKKYYRALVLMIMLLGVHFSSTAQIKTEHLYCENKTNPIGVDNVNPELTWILSSQKQNKKQSAYQIQVSENSSFTSSIIWNSNKVNSEQSVGITYQGPDLKSLTKYFWRVKVWDEKGKSSPWSTVASWQMGILNSADWKAQWITMGYKEDPERQSPAFRKEVFIRKKVQSATLCVTSHGLYQAFLNGKKIVNAYLTPGWTSYNKRLQYQVYDVTNMLAEGKNAIGALLGSGWYRGTLAWSDNKNLYGNELALLLQLNINYTDGTSEVLGTDSTWKAQKSSIVYSEIYNGETIDARKKTGKWKSAGYNDNQWPSVLTKPYGFGNLVATYNQPVTKHEEIQPVKIITTPDGDTVIDFGQNLVGWVVAEVSGNKGDSLIIDHAEMLDKNGNFYTENLRVAKQKNIYILSGDGVEHFEPHFTWQGFQYIRIKGNVKNLSEDNFKAVVLYSDMPETGSFTTSNKLLNQLQHNIQWGQKGNFLDVPTDCPQRDERLGWTGDAQVFFKTAAFNMDVNNFFSKWMKDVAADQFENGSIPHVIPNVLGANQGGSAGWGDVSTIIPWNMYLLYGNKKVLARQYNSMKSWVDYMKTQSTGYLWNSGNHFGDWLFYRPDDDTDGRSAITDKNLIAQCFFAHSTQLLINSAEILGKDEDVTTYTRLLQEIKAAFLKEYVTPNGRLVSDTQTAYVLALNFDMLPKNLREQAANRLTENIKRYGYHLTTGFLGTPYLCSVLSEFGYHDLAYTLLMQQNYPSWLYPVTKGATTIWERWDGLKPNGDFQNPGMNSFNHYAYGAIGDWMYRNLAGINTSEEPGEVGYKKIILRPHFKNHILSEEVKRQNKNDTLSEVKATLRTYYGTINSHWKIKGEKIIYHIEIPVNTTADVYLPVSDINFLKENNKPVKSTNKFTIKTENGETKVSLGSGKYSFSFNL
ncbi:alpha-L-rhamnosidase [Abyssalbus ytuae]|uniref:alpha-L-rhamnosidase n=1 Tax=Abyssalbus ytuae TaxID=2926907 RepID=A0A9E7D3Q4_9FLAO|nr:alpha-L-rhamnosidase [Abyssalbus ytuae]UOB18099.1 glycoside hydrolase family 78 protein [Abyssalbus ytuae]